MQTVNLQYLFSPFCIGNFRFENRVFKISGSKMETDISARAAERFDFFSRGENIDEVSEWDILKIPEIYAQEALAARKEGYQVCVIQGGFGTFLGGFISPGTNRRKDRWGGSLENRMRLALQIIDRIYEMAGSDLILEFRMSGAEFLPGGYTVEEGIKIAKILDGRVDIIYVEAGVDHAKNTFSGKYPSMGILHGSNIRLAAKIKRNVNAMVATTGGLDDPKMMNDIIAAGKADILYSDLFEKCE